MTQEEREAKKEYEEYLNDTVSEEALKMFRSNPIYASLFAKNLLRFILEDTYYER